MSEVNGSEVNGSEVNGSEVNDSDFNGTIMQYFHGYLPIDDSHWQTLQQRAAALANAGITALWLPPVQPSEGQYLKAVQTLQAHQIAVYADIVPLAWILNRQLSNQTTAQQDLIRWGKSHLETKISGFRLSLGEAPLRFWIEWLNAIQQQTSDPLFAMGEDWTDIETLHCYINATFGNLSILDVPLHYNFHRASRAGGYYDMSKILDGTLTQQQPALAVSFVENHLSQPLGLLESVVEPWFKPLAYAIILLRREGYPCIFYPDYYGGHYFALGKDGKEHEIWLNSHRWLLDKFLHARQTFAYGSQYDYFDHPSVIGWTRLGNAEHPKAMAVMMSDGWGGSKWMEVGKPDAAFYDLTEHIQVPVYSNENGWGEFHCKGGSVSVWIEE
jgi:alpha-amylase